MNFFKHQDQARRQTKWLVLLFALAVVVIIVAVDVVLLFAFGAMKADDGQGLAAISDVFRNGYGLMAGGAAGTGAVIGIASLFKMLALRDGGGKVARDVGGTLVDPDTRDPLRRRLRNVVEEISIASGVPVPEVYVLEREQGINAFAAGYSPSDAAIAVTRGALEKLDRRELQGVIAHEFSHVFNGDMRLNIRLMGALFGILVLALIARRVMRSSMYTRSSSNKNGLPVIVIAGSIMAIGYAGLFFGRWIKAAVSRQREYLADASALQFTRDPDSIGGALKKIAIYSDHSYLNVDSEEVGHMLFGAGRNMHLFATHPPIMERIGRIEPGFDEQRLKDYAESIKRKIEREARRAEREAEREAQRKERAEKGPASALDPTQIVDAIGNPEFGQVLAAAVVAGSLPPTVKHAARSDEWAPEALLLTLLDKDPEIREHQLLAVAQRLGSDSEEQMRALVAAAGPLSPRQRLPLMEVAFPAIRRRPPDFFEKFLATVHDLVEADGRVDVFEYALSRLISQHLWEAANPHQVRVSGKGKLAGAADHAATVLAVLARHGHGEDPEAARKAFAAGWAKTGLEAREMPEVADWPKALDAALKPLDRLSLGQKQALIEALIATATADDEVVSDELELLRCLCSLLHVPLPMLGAEGE